MELGTGILDWQRSERIIGRYGTIGLRGRKSYLALSIPEGTAGKLYARVEEMRESSHVGDIVSGYSAEKRFPAGRTVLLGEGELFSEVQDYADGMYYGVGVKPLDGRDENWLDPKALYKLHDSVVTLIFEAD